MSGFWRFLAPKAIEKPLRNGLKELSERHFDVTLFQRACDDTGLSWVRRPRGTVAATGDMWARGCFQLGEWFMVGKNYNQCKNGENQSKNGD